LDRRDGTIREPTLATRIAVGNVVWRHRAAAIDEIVEIHREQRGLSADVRRPAIWRIELHVSVQNNALPAMVLELVDRRHA